MEEEDDVGGGGRLRVPDHPGRGRRLGGRGGPAAPGRSLGGGGHVGSPFGAVGFRTLGF